MGLTASPSTMVVGQNLKREDPTGGAGTHPWLMVEFHNRVTEIALRCYEVIVTLPVN